MGERLHTSKIHHCHNIILVWNVKETRTERWQNKTKGK